MGRYAVIVYALRVIEDEDRRHNEHAHGLLVLEAEDGDGATKAGMRYALIKCPVDEGWTCHYTDARHVDDLSEPETEWRSAS